MDNLTHTLTGLLLARAGFDRITPRAGLLMMLAANAPDIDVVSGLGGALDYLRYHRWVTHSLVFLPVLAVLPVAFVRLFVRRRFRWGPAYLASLVAVASHLLLDWTNVYGVRLLAPLSERWFRLDITSIVDFWIWAVLLVGWLGPALARLVNSEIGAGRGSARGMALAVLSLVTFYDFGRFLAHERAMATLDSRLYNNSVPARVLAIPGPADPFRWTGIVEGANFVSVLPVDLLAEFDPAAGRIFYEPADSPALESARRSDVFRQFLRFSQVPFWRVTPLSDPEDSTRVEVMDLRFGTPARPGFMATAVVSSALKVLNATFSFGSLPPAQVR